MGRSTLVFAARTVLSLVLALPAAAQEGMLAGTVTDAETGAPVAQAQIQILGGGDRGGRFPAPTGSTRPSSRPARTTWSSSSSATSAPASRT